MAENTQQVAAATTAASLSTSQWSSLYRDALGCITRCRKWNAQIFREESTPQQLLLCLKSPCWIVNLIESPLRRHVRAIKMINPMAHNDFYLIVTHCPQIRSLDSTLNFSQEYPFPHRYPRSLTAITLTCEFSYADGFRPHEAWRPVQEIIDEISQIPTLTEIRIGIKYRLNSIEGEDDIKGQPPDNLFRPLLRLADQLRVFHFSSQGTNLTRNHIEVLRAFHQLEDLNININVDFLEFFLQCYTADPAPSRVKVIHLGHSVQLEYLPYLARLPSLTRLGEAIELDCADWPLLSNLALLEELTLQSPPGEELTRPSLTNVIWKHFSLHNLTLDMHVSSDQLCFILSAAPQLRTLTLSHLAELESLEFATRVPHLQQTLESLTLIGWSKVRSSPKLLLPLSHLRSLRRLELQAMFYEYNEPDETVIKLFSLQNGKSENEWDYVGTRAKQPIDCLHTEQEQEEQGQQEQQQSDTSTTTSKPESKKRKNDSNASETDGKTEKKVKLDHDNVGHKDEQSCQQVAMPIHSAVHSMLLP